MGFAIHLDVFDPDAAKRAGKPYELRLGINTATQEQFEAGLKLLTVLYERMIKTYEERFLETSTAHPGDRDGDLEEGGE